MPARTPLPGRFAGRRSRQRFVVDRMSRRRARFSSSATSVSMAPVCGGRTCGGFCQSPSIRACRMNSSRHRRRVDRPSHRAGRHDRDAVQGHLLGGHIAPLPALPTGSLYVRRTRCRRGFDPLRFILARSGPTTGTSRPSSAAITQRGGFLNSANRGTRELGIARAEELVARSLFQPDVRQQAGSSAVWTWSGSRWFVHGEAEVAGDMAQLAVQVLPFPHPQVSMRTRPGTVAEPVAGQLLLLLPQVFPQVQVRYEVGVGVGESRVLLGGPASASVGRSRGS